MLTRQSQRANIEKLFGFAFAASARRDEQERRRGVESEGGANAWLTDVEYQMDNCCVQDSGAQSATNGW